MSGLLEAKVKSVLSGDTIVLHHVNNPRQERTLSLAYVSAPRLRREGDEVSEMTICASFVARNSTDVLKHIAFRL